MSQQRAILNREKRAKEGLIARKEGECGCRCQRAILLQTSIEVVTAAAEKD
jgi:hypothetical protein